MEPLKDEQRVLQSLVRHKELPASWSQDTHYSVNVHCMQGAVAKVIVHHQRESDIVVTEYEPLRQRDGSLEPSLFMLKTSEVYAKPDEIYANE